ncbi:MAG: hypothetical protein HYY03_08185 [Chloroflexi bacterium]|nr:hypothetical protein [Chloroflexota bacterium]
MLSRVAWATILVVAGAAAAVFAGVVEALLASDHPWVYLATWWLLALHLIFAATVVASGLGLAARGRRSIVEWMTWGAVPFSLLLMALVLGTFAPYWGGWGDLSLRELESDLDYNWAGAFAVLMAVALIGGSVLGLIMALFGRVWYMLHSRWLG